MKIGKASSRGALLLLMFGCDNQDQGWTGWVNPSTVDRTYSIRLSGFETFEQCRQAATGMLRSFKATKSGTFKCGYKCEWDDRVRTNVCEITRN